jgi:hypothetical protein
MVPPLIELDVLIMATASSWDKRKGTNQKRKKKNIDVDFIN